MPSKNTYFLDIFKGLLAVHYDFLSQLKCRLTSQTQYMFIFYVHVLGFAYLFCV